MTMNLPWREIYRAALLEIQPEEMRRRIDAAEKAIYRRNEELKQTGSQCAEEQQAMADALRALRLLARAECRPRPSPETDVHQSEVKP
jgi:ATP/maltotriose-dependent transcriptional regulator MalT